MSGTGRETLLDVQEALSDVLEWSEDTDKCPGVVGGPHRCPGVVGRPSRMTGSGRGPSWMSGTGRETLPDVQEALSDVQEWLGGPHKCPGVIGRPSRMPGSG